MTITDVTKEIFTLDHFRTVYVEQNTQNDRYRCVVLDSRITLLIDKELTLVEFFAMVDFLKGSSEPGAMILANEKFG